MSTTFQRYFFNPAAAKPAAASVSHTPTAAAAAARKGFAGRVWQLSPTSSSARSLNPRLLSSMTSSDVFYCRMSCTQGASRGQH